MAKTSVSMKAVIFAGGIGSRMWPLSRQSSPKQFEPIVGRQSTLQMTVDRMRPDFAWNDLYISTGEVYRLLIQKQLPHIPPQNIIGEPEMRDVAPAVGYLMCILAQKNPQQPTVILWSDHLVNRVDRFKQAIFAGGEYLKSHPDKIVFIGQSPRFANQNLGWIKYGKPLCETNGIKIYSFEAWHYRPDQETADRYFESGQYAWNPGYFIVTPQNVLKQFETYAPKMYQQLKRLQDSYGQNNHQEILNAVYPQMEKISYDNAILEKIPADQAVVLSVDLGWSDIGTWEALKEALQKDSGNITHGSIASLDTNNSVIYNYTDQLVTTIDLDKMVVVVTQDAILVAPQQSIPKIKTLLSQFKGTDKEKYT